MPIQVPILLISKKRRQHNARIFVLNRGTGDLDLVYRAYPLYQGNWNDLVHCNQLPSVDLRFWQEFPSFAKEAQRTPVAPKKTAADAPTKTTKDTDRRKTGDRHKEKEKSTDDEKQQKTS